MKSLTKYYYVVVYLIMNTILIAQPVNPYYYNALNSSNIQIKLDNVGGLEYNYSLDSTGTNTHYSGAIWNILTGSDQILFDQGLWFVGKRGEEIKASSAMWNIKYSPGPILEGKPAMELKPEDSLKYRVYRIEKGDDINNIDYADWPTDFGAPLDSGDKPLVKGDQTLWSVYNTLENFRAPSRGEWDGNNIPLEIRQTAFSYNSNSADEENIFANVIFFEWEIINKGSENLDSSFIGFWSDIDFYNAYDNLPAIDTINQLGFCWNGDYIIDSSEIPPAVGYTLLYGPGISSINSTGVFKGNKLSNFTNLSLSSFHPIGDDSTPQPLERPPWNVNEVWNIARGYDADGNIIYDSTAQLNTRFPYSGDPVTGEGWLYSSGRSGGGAGFVFFSGPFTFEPNDTQWVMIALVPGIGNNRFESITNMRKKVEILRSLPYDSLAYGKSRYVITDVKREKNPNLTDEFKLQQNYPNPFNPVTTIKYSIPFNLETSHDLSLVQLKIFDVLGCEVKILVKENQKPGNYSVEFDASELSSGVYFYKLEVDNFISTKKMILLK